MQTDKSVSVSKLFLQTLVDWKDEVEEKLDRARSNLVRLVGNVSERESHDALTAAACRDQKSHDDICLGLLQSLLLEKETASKCYRDISFINRDNFTVVVEMLAVIILEKYHKLTDVTRSQLLWVIREMVKGGVNGADMLCWNLMRQIAGGDVSGRNLWLVEGMLDIYMEHRSSWLDKYPVLIAAVIYTYLRIIEDHTNPALASLRQKEVTFVVSLIRDHFTEVCMSQQIGLGRDFLRQLQAVSRIPEFEALWVDLLYNPKTLSPHLTGISQLLTGRTSRKYLQSRLTPDMEKKIGFLTSQVRFGVQKRYQDWFQKQYFSTPESHTLRADIIRYIVCVIHPPNEILCSDILPRWAVIGWLLTTCTNPVAGANAKLALFFDWLVFDPAKDNIMNIEPGILVMYHSLKPHLAITATLLDFLIRLTYEYWPSAGDRIKNGVGAALRTIMEKRVLASLEPVLENPKLEPELRRAIQDHLIVLLDRNNGVNGPEVTNSSPNNHSDNHFPESIIHSVNLPLASQLSAPVVNNNNSTLTLTSSSSVLPPIITHRSSPPPNASINSVTTNNNTHNLITTSTKTLFDSISTNSQISSKNSRVNSITFNQLDAVIKEEKEDPGIENSKPTETASVVSQRNVKAKVSFGSVPSKHSNTTPVPALPISSDETERARVFEIIQSLPTNMRLPFESMLNSSGMNLANRSDLLDEVLTSLSEEVLEKEKLEDVAKCFLYIYKSELKKPCVDEISNCVIEGVSISPVNELLSMVVQLKPSDKSLKMKNVIRVLSEMITNQPSIAYKLLIIVYQMFEKDPNVDEMRYSKNSYEGVYKSLSHLRGMKLELQLLQDLKCCGEYEPYALSYLYPMLYSWYEDETLMTGSPELLHILVSSLDPLKLQDLAWTVMHDSCIFFVEDTCVPLLLKTLDWESWEQHCVWTLVSAQLLRTEDFQSIIPQLDAKKHAEALTAILMILRREAPNQDIVNTLLCRTPNAKDKFVLSVFRFWCNDFPDLLADVLASGLVRASGGSPSKRKRGGAGGGRSGTGSPAGIPTPTLDNVLAHLDQLRQARSGGTVIFARDIMLAALFQVQVWMTESQKVKYRDLLALAVGLEEADEKESRPPSGTKRAGTPKKLPSSPTSAGSGSAKSGSSVSTSTSGRGSSQALPRTRSGKTRTPLKDDYTDSSDEDDDIPRPKKLKRRKNYSALNSDSD